jgi:phospholipid transport system transporter-binding protein
MLVSPEAITHSNAVACLADFSRALASEVAAEVVLDAEKLNRFDSAALAVLLEVRRNVLKMGKSLVLRNAPQRLQDLAALYGIAELLPSKA